MNKVIFIFVCKKDNVITNQNLKIMKENWRSRLENMTSSIKYWWLLLIAGVGVAIIGILAFIYPAASYVTFSIMFGILILCMGVLYSIFAISNRKNMVGWGWYLAGGILEIIFALFLLLRWDAAMVSLPIFLGAWLMFRGITAIAAASELQSWGVKGMGWSIVAGILLIVCSIIILWNPMTVGASFAVIFIGLGLLVMGVQLILFSIQLQKIHAHFKDIHKRVSGEK